jgi:hypothetical protein
VFDGVFEPTEVDRLGEMLGEAGREARFDVVGRSMTREGDARRRSL